MTIWIFGRRPREGERIMPKTFAELDAYTERAIDAMLERNDAFFITASAARYLADEGHFTIVDDSDRRNIVLRRADPC